jgi:dTDP-4-dehydrorhamnose 3,5-epimerase
MKFLPTDIPDVIRIEPEVHSDDRGFFMETWRRQQFDEAGLTAAFVQENHSRSQRGVLRGLHYQISKPQGKLVRVVRGEVFDVAVDLRRSSPTFRTWIGVTLSEDNKQQLWVPPGFAHGFLVLSQMADIVYRCTEYFAPEFERVLLWDDTAVSIDWPLPRGIKPSLSEKDSLGSLLAEAETYP